MWFRLNFIWFDSSMWVLQNNSLLVIENFRVRVNFYWNTSRHMREIISFIHLLYTKPVHNELKRYKIKQYIIGSLAVAGLIKLLTQWDENTCHTVLPYSVFKKL